MAIWSGKSAERAGNKPPSSTWVCGPSTAATWEASLAIRGKSPSSRATRASQTRLSTKSCSLVSSAIGARAWQPQYSHTLPPRGRRPCFPSWCRPGTAGELGAKVLSHGRDRWRLRQTASWLSHVRRCQRVALNRSPAETGTGSGSADEQGGCRERGWATGSRPGAVCGLRSGATARKDAELVPLWVGKYDPALIACLADVGVPST